MVHSVWDWAERASSGNCSNARGLAASARFFLMEVSSFSAQHAPVRGGAERVSQGKASFALGLAATARLFTTSSELNTCPMLFAGLSDNAAAVTASRYNLFFVFILSFWFSWRVRVERCAVGYFIGATSNFFSIPFVAANSLLLVEQQARLSAPQLVHLWTAAVVFALP